MGAPTERFVLAGWPGGQQFQPLDGWINTKYPYLAGARFSILNKMKIAMETKT